MMYMQINEYIFIKKKKNCNGYRIEALRRIYVSEPGRFK